MQNHSFKSFKPKIYYFVLWTYFFYTDAYENFFICSYLRINFSNCLPYLNILTSILTLYLLILLKYWRSNTNSYKITLSDFLIVIFLFNFYKIIWTFKNSIYLINLILNKWQFFITKHFLWISEYAALINNFVKYNWAPLFKKHSYLGYFRVTRDLFINYNVTDFIRLKT
jgi:hypothetical protein